MPRLARQIGGNHAALGLWQLSYWLRAAAAEPIGLGQTKGCFYNRVFPEPLSVCKAPWAPCRGNPRRGFPREKTVHRTVFSPPPALRSALPGASLLGPLRENSATAVAARGYSPLDSRNPFEKGLTENFFVLRRENPLHWRRRCDIILSKRRAPKAAAVFPQERVKKFRKEN